jgi:hypothetical protein
MIRLERTGSDQSVRALLARLCDQEFQFPGFVPAKGEAGLIVALNKQLWTAQGLGKPGQCFDQSGQMSESNSWNIHRTVNNRPIIYGAPSNISRLTAVQPRKRLDVSGNVVDSQDERDF